MRPRFRVSERKKVIFIVGPTAVGKSRVAFELAKRIRGEIISCDSMQVYHHMPIASQSPPKGWKKRVPHHLVDVVDPASEYSAAQFREKATLLIEDIIKRGRIPLVVGGSGLYMKSLLDGLFPSPKKDELLRDELTREAASNGPAELHARLEKIDPKTASKIHPNDLRRIIRALEVYYLTGIPVSEHKLRTKGLDARYDVKIFGLDMPRHLLYKKTNERAERMFKEGLVDEIKRISKRKLSKTAAASLGYKEVIGYLRGEYSLEDARRLLKRNTRRYAKRQLSWFRQDKRIKWLDLDENNDKKIIGIIERACLEG